MSSHAIDLNADLGEGYPNDETLLELVTSASICCNAHAGSKEGISRTLIAAAERGVKVGAHPGYPDREGFGRREREMTAQDVSDLIIDQWAVIHTLAAEAGASVRFLKPHGALYNQAQRQSEIAWGVIAAASRLRVPLFGQPGTLLEELAASGAVQYVQEGFPDRRYRDDGSLLPRSQPGAILTDPAEIEAQVLCLVNEGRVKTLCIHGDDPRAVANAELVRDALMRHGIAIRPILDGPS